MKTIYRSRIDWFMKSALVLMIVATFGPINWMMNDHESSYFVFAYVGIMLLTLGFMLHLVFSTCYTFHEND